MRNIIELIGIIKGINCDGVINDKEIVFLQSWINKNRNLVCDNYQASLIDKVTIVIEDKIITDDERHILITTAEEYLKKRSDISTPIFELNGIISGIICDGIINEAEIYHLSTWMDVFGDSIIDSDQINNIYVIIKEILKDGKVTEVEQKMLLELLSTHIHKMKFDLKIDYLRKLVRLRKYIGIDLIDILDNQETMDEIHQRAEEQLRLLLLSKYSKIYHDPEVIVISLVLIALLEYDGNFYGNVRQKYHDLYSNFSEQRIEGQIRNVLSRYKLTNEIESSRSRIINVALENAIVPRYYLAPFFEFIHDIYKLNFEFDLSDNLFMDFKFVYEGLHNNMLSDGDEVKINVTQKTYKLIKSTKQLIANGKNLDQIIKLSIIIVKIIDNTVWGKDNSIYNPYILYGYEGWLRHYNRIHQGDRTQKITSIIHSQWEPKLTLLNCQVYLAVPMHKIKAQYDYQSIKIAVFNDERIVFENTQLDIREIIGGYQVIIGSILITKPLGKLTYMLYAGEEVIYNSADKLYRNVIAFDLQGNEIKNYTNFNGNVVFCYYSNDSSVIPYYSTSYYSLTSQAVNRGDCVVFGNQTFCFTSIVKPGVFGEEYDNSFLLRHEDGMYLNVYRKIDSIMFESNDAANSFLIQVNKNLYKLSELDYDVVNTMGIRKYIVNLDISVAGVYSLAVVNTSFEKKQRIASFNFAVDSNLVLDEIKLDDMTYLVSVNTDFSCSELLYDICVNNCSENDICFFYAGKEYSYNLPFHFDIYRISKRQWLPFSESIWINDINHNSYIELLITEIQKATVYSDTGEMLQELNLKQSHILQWADVGFLISYKMIYNYVIILLDTGNGLSKSIYCYYRCVLNEDEIEFLFDPVKQTLTVTTSYFGKGNVYFEIFDSKKGKSVYKSGMLKNGDVDIVFNLNSFVEYYLCYYEHQTGLLKSKDRLLKQYNQIYYARSDLVRKSYKITEVFYYQFNKGTALEKKHYFNRVYVYFAQQLSDDHFIGEVYAKTSTGIFMLFNINPVDIEICSDIIDSIMDVYITKDGDGLLLDLYHNSIMNSLYDPLATDIFSYSIDMNEVHTI